MRVESVNLLPFIFKLVFLEAKSFFRGGQQRSLNPLLNTTYVFRKQQAYLQSSEIVSHFVD